MAEHQELPGSSHRIDVHAHYLPAAYRERLLEAGLEHPDNTWTLPTWNVEQALAVMDRQGIATAVLSVSSPGVHFAGSTEARGIARLVNEAAAGAIHDHPTRFGGFASLPLPDVTAALAELEYALDTLGLDGVVLLTNYDGVYLGDQRLDPLFEELNRRKVVTFLHPTSPPCAETISLGYPRPIIEFPFDTTRAVMHLIVSNTLTRYPDLRLIVPHAGGTLPFLAGRISRTTMRSPGAEQRDPGGAEVYLRRLHYDLAGSPSPYSLASLLQLVEPDRLLYGSDWPFTPEPAVERDGATLQDNPLIRPEDLSRIFRDNALELFPRLAAGAGRR